MTHPLVEPLVRIIIYVLNGALLATGLLTAAQGEALTANPEVQAFLTLAVSAAIQSLTMWWWSRARKVGGPT